jgi:hypothetical protein
VSRHPHPVPLSEVRDHSPSPACDTRYIAFELRPRLTEQGNDPLDTELAKRTSYCLHARMWRPHQLAISESYLTVGDELDLY